MYKYDVFISYKRGGTRDEWMSELFYPMFNEKLDEAFANEGLETPKIFYDQKEIKDGSDWQMTLRQAIAKSKFMVSVCTPTYFRRSEWCMREFAAMYYRAKKTGLLSNSNPTGLISPLVKQQIKFPPPFLKVIQLSDYTNFNRVGIAFKNTSEYLDFQKKVQDDCGEIAGNIHAKTPPWNDNFETSEWLDDPYEDIISELKIEEPKQEKPSW
jgi:hypothetical protein